MQIIVYLALMVASYLISAAMAPKPQNAKPAALSDFDIPQVDEGTFQSVIFGDCMLQDWFVLAYGNYRTQDIKKSDGSKK